MHKLNYCKKFNNTTWLNCYSRAPKFNNIPRNACLAIIFGMCTES